ncbi:MAG: hypothetical protein LBU51_10335 [Bacteroidales bacterium]|jgi:flagellar motor component MotA|nr:hypothetical protein [Bacteroidales bacterium]
MTRDEFATRYRNMVDLAVAAAEKATAEGLLSLEDDLHDIQLKEKAIFENGICLIIKKLEDSIKQKLVKSGKDLSVIDFSEMPILFRMLFNLRYSMTKKGLSKKVIIKDEKALFEYGLYLVCNCEDYTTVKRKLNKKIKREKDRAMRILEALTVDIVLLFQCGTGAEHIKTFYNALDYIILVNGIGE